MERIHQFVTEQFNADRIIRLAARRSDEEDFSMFTSSKDWGTTKKPQTSEPVPIFYIEVNT